MIFQTIRVLGINAGGFGSAGYLVEVLRFCGSSLLLCSLSLWNKIILRWRDCYQFCLLYKWRFLLMSAKNWWCSLCWSHIRLVSFLSSSLSLQLKPVLWSGFMLQWLLDTDFDVFIVWVRPYSHTFPWNKKNWKVLLKNQVVILNNWGGSSAAMCDWPIWSVWSDLSWDSDSKKNNFLQQLSSVAKPVLR